MIMTVTDGQTKLLVDCDYSNWHGVWHRTGVSNIHCSSVSPTFLKNSYICHDRSGIPVGL